MIRKLKVRFVVLAMTALFVLLALIVLGMNWINYHSVVQEADEILTVLSKNKGDFPEPGKGPADRLPPNMSPETPDESRYFSVTLNGAGEVTATATARITSVDSAAAAAYAQTVFEAGKTEGFVDAYRFVVRAEKDGTRITFLDCGRKLDAFYRFLGASLFMSAAGFAVVFVVIFILSSRIIRPIAESYEKQKRFITDAGHEIKTPLTIIGANADILEMEFGENESLSDIQHEVKRLRSLTEDLVMLARMEEGGDAMPKIAFPISEVVAEAVHPFRALAVQQGKTLVCNIQPLLTLRGNDKAIVQLVSILMDNALKYAPTGSAVVLELAKQNRTVCLSAFNMTETEIREEQLHHVFDRFYRTDGSRSSETGGHGIGLSVAKAIVTAHGGTISAWTQDGYSFGVSATFPS